jgi:hypothetical protein
MGINTFPAATATGNTNFGGVVPTATYGEIPNTGTSSGATFFTINRTVPAGTYLFYFTEGGSSKNITISGNTLAMTSTGQVFKVGSTASSYTVQTDSTWNETVATRNLTGISGISTIVYGNGRYVIQPYGPAGNAFGCVSTNGANWTTSAVWTAAGTGINMGFANERFIANPSNAQGCVRISTDGLNWTTALTWSTNATVRGGWAYADAQSTYFSPADNGAIIVSTNLTTWTSRATVSGTGSGGRALYVNPWWIAANSTLVISTNGTTWTTRNTGITDIADIAYGNDRYVVVRNTNTAGAVAVSTDTVNWTTVSLPWSSAAPTSIVYGNGHFFCIGNGLNVSQGAFSSTDGLNWNRRSPAVGGANSSYIVTWGTTGGYISLIANGGDSTKFRSFTVAGRSGNEITWHATAAETHNY